jgi:hypothetical protein
VVAPQTPAARRLGEVAIRAGATPATVPLGDADRRYRVLAAQTNGGELSLELGISLAETDATLAAFDQLIGGSAAVFLILAVFGGLSREWREPLAVDSSTTWEYY